jgi:hypothetical protein
MHQGRLVALGTPAELTRSGACGLEEVFLELTGGAGEQDEVSRLLGGGGTDADDAGILAP